MTRKKSFTQAGVALVAGCLPIAIGVVLPESAEAATFTGTYVFGDSLSDDGNLFDLTRGLIPPSPFYAQRFSNGPVWVEYLAQRLNTPLFNFAYGGATSGQANVVNPLIQLFNATVLLPFGQTPVPLAPGVQTEVNGFLASSPPLDSQALYILFAGANDYLGGGIADPTIPVANLTSAITALAGAGARNILVPNLPDLGKVPGTLGTENSQPLTGLTLAHNAFLAQSLLGLQSTLGPQVNLIPLDLYSLVATVTNNPTAFGFTNATDSCVSPPPLQALTSVPPVIPTICSNPDQYVFWDDIHPTTAAHAQVANYAFSTLEAEAVPEPSALAGLVVAGGFFGFTVWRRKQQQKANSFVATIANPQVATCLTNVAADRS